MVGLPGDGLTRPLAFRNGSGGVDPAGWCAPWRASAVVGPAPAPIGVGSIRLTVSPWVRARPPPPRHGRTTMACGGDTQRPPVELGPVPGGTVELRDEGPGRCWAVVPPQEPTPRPTSTTSGPGSPGRC